MKKYWRIEGFWKDDRSALPESCIVTNYDDENTDDEIFYYGLSEKDLKNEVHAYALKEPNKSALEFVVTAYHFMPNYQTDADIRDLQFIFRRDDRFNSEQKRRHWVINNMSYLLKGGFDSLYRTIRENAFRTIEALYAIYSGRTNQEIAWEEFYEYLYSEDLYNAIKTADDYNKVLISMYVLFQDQVPNGLRKLDRFVKFRSRN